MITYELFNKYFFPTQEIKWFNRKGLYSLDKTRVVDITLVTGRYSGQYECYKVKIINKSEGEIASNFFSFNEYLTASDRIDDRKDRTDKYHSMGEYHIVEDCLKIEEIKEGSDYWYMSIPSRNAIDRMVAKIYDYINSFK